MSDYKLSTVRELEEVDAEITIWPDEVELSIKSDALNLTPDRAEELASMLVTAAQDARHRQWVDPASDGLETYDDRTTGRRRGLFV